MTGITFSSLPKVVSLMDSESDFRLARILAGAAAGCWLLPASGRRFPAGSNPSKSPGTDVLMKIRSQ